MADTKHTKKESINVRTFVPDYKKPEDLAHFLTMRAKIRGTRMTGMSSKKQRLLSREIKRARFLGLLPYQLKVK